MEKPFQLRIGINTGFCTVGNFGSADRMDYTIIGNEVNLAARLESHAEVGGILMAHETHALVKDRVLAEEGDPTAALAMYRRAVDLIDPADLLRRSDDDRGRAIAALEERDATLLGHELHWRRAEGLAAPPPAVGLGDDARELVAGVEEGFEGWDGEGAAAEKDDAQPLSPPSRLGRACGGDA